MSEEKKDDGGPAFPIHLPEDIYKEIVLSKDREALMATGGMTLRDWFASVPMSDFECEMLRSQYFATTGATRVNVQELRFFRADTMLLERKK